VTLLHGEHPPSRRVVVPEIGHHLSVAVDGDSLRNEIFLDHVDQGRALEILGITTSGKAVWREIRLPAQLHDSFRDLIRVLLLFIRMLEKLRRRSLSVDARRHEVVSLVSEHADYSSRQRFVHNPNNRLAIGTVTFGNGAFLDMPPGTLVKRFDITQKRLLCHGEPSLPAALLRFQAHDAPIVPKTR